MVLLDGVLVVSIGFLINAASSYWEATSLQPFNPNFNFKLYEQELAASYFVIGVGVLIVAIGWVLSQRGSSASGATLGYRRATRELVGMILVLTGASLVAGWTVFLGAVEWASVSGVNLHLPDWFIALDGLFVGLGLLLWGAGWFGYRWS